MNRTILIVEDDETIRKNLREILETENFSVLEAENGKIALEKLPRLASDKNPLPFVILLDLNMPVMSGREFSIAQRADQTVVARIPVVVTTAAPDASDLGTFGFLRKPIDLDHLLEKLQQLVS